jgi:hypothetical protein
MNDWYNAAINETIRDQEHDDELIKVGRLVQDLRLK